MLINVGGLWDKPISVADDETFPSYSIEAYQSHEDCTHFKNFSAGTSLGSDLEYGARAVHFVGEFNEISPDKQLKGYSAESIHNQYGVSGESKGRKRATGIQMREDLSYAHTSKSLRVLSATKDRHSKVNTARGLRDTRMRLSHSTAVKFYEVQDRLGYKHPSNAIDWLMSKAQSSIDELPQPLYASKTNYRVCDFISKTRSTSFGTGPAISVPSHSNDGCSTNSSVHTSCKSQKDENEEILRFFGLVDLGIPRLDSDREVTPLSTR